MLRSQWFGVAVLALLSIAPAAVHAKVIVTPVTYLVNQDVRVAAGRCAWQELSLKAGSTLYGGFRITGAVDDQLTVRMIDRANMARFQANQAYNAFTDTMSTIRGRGTMAFVAPYNGPFYALMCNDRALMLDRLVHVEFYVTGGKLRADERDLRDLLAQLEKKLHQGFDLPAFDIRVEPCGTANAFSAPDITMCTELLDSLPEQIRGQAFVYILFHEIGHTALKLWGLPGWDNEDMADEFAAGFMLIGNQPEVLLAAAQYWRALSPNPRAEALSKVGLDDRHSLSEQRSRNLIAWAQNGEDVAQRWAAFLAPKMTDAGLRELVADPRFSSNAAVKAESARRLK